MAITNEDRLLWEQRFRERKEQGLTIAEWCRQHGFWGRFMKPDMPVPEVFLIGCSQCRTAYLFSAELSTITQKGE